MHGVVVSASQPEEEGVAALRAVDRVVFIIEVQDVLLRLETKLLVQQHGGITGRYVQRHVLPHTRLKNKHHEDVTRSSPTEQEIHMSSPANKETRSSR